MAVDVRGVGVGLILGVGGIGSCILRFEKGGGGKRRESEEMSED